MLKCPKDWRGKTLSKERVAEWRAREKNNNGEREKWLEKKKTILIHFEENK